MSTPTEAHTARVRASGYTTPQGVQMAAQFLADSPKQPEVAHARAKRLSEASNAQLSLICGELTGRELRTIRAILGFILRDTEKNIEEGNQN
jgi:hypothetical protein